MGRTVVDASDSVELSCLLITKVRADERSPPELLARLTGSLTLSSAGATFALAEPISQTPGMTDVIVDGGHRRPRRKLFLSLRNGRSHSLLLPDTLQVRSGHMEVVAKLIIDDELHADADQNEILDVPLLPLSVTHAVFHFVDADNQPLAQLGVEPDASTEERIQATTDDFGEVYLDATRGQTYVLAQVLPAEDDRLAVVETSLLDQEVAVA